MAGELVSLVQLLRQEDLLPDEQIEQARRSAEASGLPLVSILLDQRLVEAVELRDTLRRRLNLPELDPGATRIDPDAVRLVPHDEARRYRIMPVALETTADGRRLRLAMVDPLDRHACDDVAFTTGARVEPMLALDSHLEEAIHANYQGVVTRVIQRQRPEMSGSAGEPTPARGRELFGGQLGSTRLDTKPMERPPDEAGDPRFSALLSLLVRKGVITTAEFEQELRAGPEPAPDDTTEQE